MRHPPDPVPPPFFSGLGWAVAVIGIAGLSLVIGGVGHLAAAQPTKPKAPQPTATQPASAPNARPDRPLPESFAPAKGEVHHGVKEAPPKPAGAIRLATYNLENFFDAKQAKPDDAAAPSTASDADAGSPPEPKPEAHRKALAAAIHAANPDILACEEVESNETITHFRDQYLADMGYIYIASIDAGDPRGIEQSILSRFPLTDPKVWLRQDLGAPHPAKLGKKDNPESGKPMILKRSPFNVTVDIPADAGAGRPKPLSLGLFAVHHKSGALYSYLREAETTGVLHLIDQYHAAHPGVPVIVLGDFNARLSEKSIQSYLAAGFTDAFGSVVLAPGKTDKEDPRYITHVSGRAIDHILLGPDATTAFEVKTRFVLGTPQRPDNVDWRHTPPPDGYASDHYPVVIDLAPTP